MVTTQGNLRVEIDPRLHIQLRHESIDAAEPLARIVEKAIRRELEHRRNLRGGAGR